MPNRLIWHKNDRQPSISDIVMVDGTAVDITAQTWRFKMRAVNSSTLKVDQLISNTPDSTGLVRYDWGTSDLNTVGEYLVWWDGTIGGKQATVGEAIIEVREHAPQSNVYVELEQFKSTADIQGTNYMDGDIRVVISAASRAVDEICARRFYPDADATQVRYYTPHRADHLFIDDLLTLTTFKTDDSRDGTFENTWTSADYWLEPLNAAADGHPYTAVRVNPEGNFVFYPYPKSVQVTGKFGWTTIPAAITAAVTIMAGRFLKRTREAPFGAAEIQALGGAAIRLTGKDPDVLALLGPYMRHPYTH